MIYKKIMVAIDGSDSSTLALQEAIKLAAHAKAHLRLVHVIDENIVNYTEGYIDFDTLAAAYKRQGQKILDQANTLVRKAKIKCDNCLIELKLEGRLAEKIVAEAERWPADLLVIGTHGRRGFSHLFLGSVAESVIRIATFPVLLIRSQ